MSATQWQLVVCASDVPSARLLIDMLANEGIATHVVTDAAVMGQASPCRIFVDATEVYRARRLLAQEPLSESELTFLAMGETKGEEGSGG